MNAAVLAMDPTSRRYAHELGQLQRQQNPTPEGMPAVAWMMKVCPFTATGYVSVWCQGWRGVAFEEATA